MSLFKSIVFLQFSLLLLYFNANIVNVGGTGTALLLLAGYMGLCLIVFARLSLKGLLYVRIHLFLFLLLIFWVGLRVVIDLGDLEHLKQLTVATTGGMLSFYIFGAFLGVSYQTVIMKADKVLLIKAVLFVFLILLLWMIYNFSQRLHPRLFYLTGINGVYQRSGNLLSISYIVCSFLYLLLSIKKIKMKISHFDSLIWLSVYSFSTLIGLVGAQLFGSNSATMVILGVYLVTLVMSFVIVTKVVWMGYIENKLDLPWSKKLLSKLTLLILIVCLMLISVLSLLMIITDFEVTSTRLFGFGISANNSLFSRYDILMEYSYHQLSHAPIFGDMNVAYITTGSSSTTIHSFFIFVMANLGLVGLLLVFILFAAVLMQLYREIKIKSSSDLFSYEKSMVALYSCFIFIFLILFANIATGLSWSVLWFSLGFISKPFGFRSNEKNR